MYHKPLASSIAGVTVDDSSSSSPLGRYASYYFASDGTEDDHDVRELFGLPLIENASYQCSSPVLLDCCQLTAQDKPLWWLVLRWMKMMLFKIARSYHAKPLLLVILPLLLGVGIGFILGRTTTNDRSNLQQQKERRQDPLKSNTGWRDWVSMLVVRVCMVLAAGVSLTKNLWQEEATVLKNEPSAIHGTFTTSNNHNGGPQIITTSKATAGGLEQNETETRRFLKSDEGTYRESGVPMERVPQHIAVIMDGNRRYGKAKYGSAAKGHWDGSSKLVEFAKWCIAENVSVLTVFAFSSENWQRDPAEIASLMQIFATYCDELRVEAIERNIRIMVLSTDYEKIPGHVRVGVKRMVEETQHCDGMIMNICLSYGSRGEIVGATKSIVEDVLGNKIDPERIDESTIGERLLTHNYGGDPDVLIRTSGEVRISNFLLWQLAYTEFFFVPKPWPAMEKNDLLEVIRTYAKGRSRRYGR